MSLEQVLFFSSLYSRASGGAPPSPLATDGLGAGRRAGRGHNWLPGTEPVPPSPVPGPTVLGTPSHILDTSYFIARTQWMLSVFCLGHLSYPPKLVHQPGLVLSLPLVVSIWLFSESQKQQNCFSFILKPSIGRWYSKPILRN